MLDLNIRLNDIIVKYNIDKQYERFKQSLQAIELLNKVIDKYDDILFIACCETDINVIRQDMRSDKEFCYLIVDIDNKTSFDKISRDKIVIVVSYYWKNEISSLLYDKNINHINLYDFFSLNGLNLFDNYYNIFSGEYHYFANKVKSFDFLHYSPYEDIINDKKMMANTSDDNLKKLYAERLIFKFFYIRDFISAKKYIDKYLAYYNGDIIDYKSAWDEVTDLLSEIKESMNKRSQKDIMVFWVDALQYGEDQIMPFLNGVSHNSLMFENAYTVTPFTEFTLKSLLLGVKAIDDESHKIIEISKDNSEFIRNLEARDLDFKYYGLTIDTNTKKITCKMFIHRIWPSSMLYWNAVNDALNSHIPVVYIIHGCYETHFPYLSADISSNDFNNNLTDINVISQQRTSMEYIDKQLEFYSGLLSENSTKIYMSDHGKIKYENLHVVLKVQALDIPKRVEDRLFSLIDFDKLIYYVIEPDSLKYDGLFRENLVIQNLDYMYGATLAKSMDPERFKPEALVGYRGVVTDRDIYICHNHGVEYFYKHKNDNALFTPDRVEYLRGLTGTGKIDVEKEDAFKYSRYTYKVIEKYLKRNHEYEERKAEVIKRLFDDIDDNSNIAVFTGRETSFKLLLLIGLERCKKIDYIIDNDDECIAGKLGIPVINPTRLSEYSIDIIVKTIHPNTPKRRGLASYRQKEIPTFCNPGCKVIDLYEYLEDNAIKCTGDFWMYEHDDSDFEVGFPFSEAYRDAGINNY